jgi:hypothetical protein
MGRLAATYLPPAGNKSRRATTVHVLLSSMTEQVVPSEQVKDVDFDVPEEVDVLLGDLLEALSDTVSLEPPDVIVMELMNSAYT